LGEANGGGGVMHFNSAKWRSAGLGLAMLGMACLNAAGGERGMIIKSAAFADGGGIPAKYTEDGKNVSPPLAWKGVPEGAKSLVLIVDDPDAPDPRAPRMTWVHWVLFNMPSSAAGLPEGVLPEQLPDGTGEGLNDWKRTGYGGPAPPIGRHRYFFKLYALDMTLEGLGHPTKRKVVDAMQGHVLAEAVLMGTYERSR
jgi:Raf kinase inhibitor-like YbhB/YbcL family protein